LLDRAELAPQIVTRGGHRFVVIDGDEYRRLMEARPDLKDLILNGPGLEGLDLERDKSNGRDLG
jgi:hypothetical protein